jgi:hypothetical protein
MEWNGTQIIQQVSNTTIPYLKLHLGKDGTVPIK